MTAKSFIFESIVRLPKNDPSDLLEFEPGVNVVVGEPNTGKTGWLNMIDYLLGDSAPVDQALGGLAKKYQSMAAKVRIGDQSYVIERRWQEPGKKTKVFLDGEELADDEFQQRLVGLLGIPPVRFRKGGEAGLVTWPMLTWRVLFRHVYRKQTSWADLADKQPFSEQLATILQFLGLAQIVYSEAQEQAQARQLQKEKLEARRAQFLDIMQQVSRQLLDLASAKVALEPDGIKSATDAINQRIRHLHGERDRILKEAAAKSQPPPQLAEMTQKFATLQVQRSHLEQQEEKLRDQRDELKRHRIGLEAEQRRLERLSPAVRELGPLEVTNCPACNRELDAPRDEDHCHVCQARLAQAIPGKDPDRRLTFERERLKVEQTEIKQLLDTVERSLAQIGGQRRAATDQLNGLSNQIQQLRSPAPITIPPELSQLDVQVGQNQERLNQLRRVGEALQTREELNASILALEAELLQLQQQSKAELAQADFKTPANELSKHVNRYLRQVNDIRPDTWKHPPAQVLLEERNFSLRVGDRPWNDVLGGTLRLYFLLAYNYGLLALTGREPYNYPGVFLADLPPNLEGTDVADQENFAIEPFVTLCGKSERPMQVIAFGNSFKGFTGGKRIELTTVWEVMHPEPRR